MTKNLGILSQPSLLFFFDFVSFINVFNYEYDYEYDYFHLRILPLQFCQTTLGPLQCRLNQGGDAEWCVEPVGEGVRVVVKLLKRT